MAGIELNNGVINYGGVPSAGAGLLANRPSFGVTGRLYIGTDTNAWYRDTGTAWVTISAGISGSAATGQATFWSSATTISGDNAFFWDNTNKRLGLGTTTPGVRLDVHSAGGTIAQFNGTGTTNAYLDFQNAGTTKWRLGNNYLSATHVWTLFNTTLGTTAMIVNQTNQVMIGTGTPLEKFCVTTATGQTGFMETVSSPVRGNLFYDTDGSGWNFNIGKLQSGIFSYQLKFFDTLVATFASRLNVNGATDNALFELNVNGNTYTGGLSPTILTVSTNTTMARTATGYYVTATATLTLPGAASINNWYIVIAGAGATVTVQRSGTDTILDKTGASVTSVTVAANTRSMFYVGGGTITFQIF